MRLKENHHTKLSKSYFRLRHEQELKVPETWLNDGVSDCEGGEDELNMWPTCKFIDGYRPVVDNSSCKNVFLCKAGSLDYTELSQLCDGKEDCGEEKSVCHASSAHSPIFTTAISVRNHKHLFYCLPGLYNFGKLTDPCVRKSFKNPNFPVFGLTSSKTLVVPNKTVTCEYIFGELLVYFSCIGFCTDVECPLKILNHDSCRENNVERFYTLSDYNSLTIILKDKGWYTTDVFSCENGYCVSYDKVCNLFDDCGDQSDELLCSNKFQCNSSNMYITKDKECDGNIDCPDYSDECNLECGKEIISVPILKVFAWLIGGVAVALNLFILLNVWNTWNICRQIQINTIFKIIINIGDLLTGMYLLLIAIFDGIVFGEKYCEKQLAWLSSQYCSSLGVMSTIGANLSLLSMMALSICRTFDLTSHRNPLQKYFKFNITFIISVMIAISFTLALIPLLNRYEDFFVNGMIYNEDIKLFNSIANKATHINVLRAYYGKISKDYLSWKEIETLFGLMFTRNYAKITPRKIHFYGNEGVCLFKYFVKKQDPQIIFVWSNLTINFACFVVICVCYVIIATQTRNQRRRIKCSKNIKDANAKKVVMETNRNRLQVCITAIIVTDLVCWIPFIFACILHSLEVLDATFLYSFCSIIVLPINSVVNPILYHDYFRNWICETNQRLRLRLNELTSTFTMQKSENPRINVEMSVMDTMNRSERADWSSRIEASLPQSSTAAESNLSAVSHSSSPPPSQDA